MIVKEIKELEDGSTLIEFDDLTNYEYFRLTRIGYQLSCYTEYDEGICAVNAIEYILVLKILLE